MTKKRAQARIKAIKKNILNDAQKSLYCSIINNCSAIDVEKTLAFLLKKVPDWGIEFANFPEKDESKLVAPIEKEMWNILDKDYLNNLETKLIIGKEYGSLKALLLIYEEKFDIVFIDINLDNYDNFYGKNGVFTLFKQKIELINKLMNEDSVIFITVNEKHESNFKLILDEIFEGNHIGTIDIFEKNNKNVWRKYKDFQYVLAYKKGNFKVAKIKEKQDESKYKLEDSISKYKKVRLTKSGRERQLWNRPKMGYIVYYNPTTKDIKAEMGYDSDSITIKQNPVYIYNEKLKSEGYVPIIPGRKNGEWGRWTWGFATFLERIKDIHVEKIKGDYIVYRKKRFVGKKYTPPKDYYEITNEAQINKKNHNINEGKVELIKWLIARHEGMESTVLGLSNKPEEILSAVQSYNEKKVKKRKCVLIADYDSFENYKNFSKYYANKKQTSLRVFVNKYYDIETNQIDKQKSIIKQVVASLDKLSNSGYKPTQLQVYYDLNTLNPLKEECEMNLNDKKTIHKESKRIFSDEKHYCICGKSFYDSKKFKKHIKVIKE